MLYKIFSGIVVLLFITFVVTGMIFLSPVDAERLSFGQRSSAKTVEEVQKKYGLDQSLGRQYRMYMADLSPFLVLPVEHERLQYYKYTTLFEIGGRIIILKRPYLRESYQTGRPVAQILAEVIPLTVLLALLSMSLALTLGLFLGLMSAKYHDTLLDRAIVSFSVLGYSVPSYVSSLVLALVFGYFLAPWTGLEVQGSLFELDDLGNTRLRMKNLILPVIALGTRPIAVITQLTRSSTLDVLGQNYVRTAYAKGLSDMRIWTRHILRNALTPVATASTGWLASMLTGAFFVEVVFNFKGLGYTTVNALLNFDIPLILACVLLAATIIISLNILVDFIYAWLDPRARVAMEE